VPRNFVLFKSGKCVFPDLRVCSSRKRGVFPQIPRSWPARRSPATPRCGAGLSDRQGSDRDPEASARSTRSESRPFRNGLAPHAGAPAESSGAASHSWQMCRPTGAGDDDLNAARLGSLANRFKPVGRAMRRDDPCTRAARQTASAFRRRGTCFPVRLAAHDYGDEGVGVIVGHNPFFKRTPILT